MLFGFEEVEEEMGADDVGLWRKRLDREFFESVLFLTVRISVRMESIKTNFAENCSFDSEKGLKLAT